MSVKLWLNLELKINIIDAAVDIRKNVHIRNLYNISIVFRVIY